MLGLELGADDYITKPFSIREFRSRIRAVLRRATAAGRAAEPDERADPAGRSWSSTRPSARSRSTARPVALTYVEFEVLRTLVTHRGRVYSRQALLEAVWGGCGVPRAAHDRRPHPPPAREARGRPGRSAADPDGARRRLLLPRRLTPPVIPRARHAPRAPDRHADGGRGDGHGRGVPLRRADAARPADRQPVRPAGSGRRGPSRRNRGAADGRSEPQVHRACVRPILTRIGRLANARVDVFRVVDGKPVPLDPASVAPAVDAGNPAVAPGVRGDDDRPRAAATAATWSWRCDAGVDGGRGAVPAGDATSTPPPTWSSGGS